MSGHTGILIDSGRANAVKWMDRILLEERAAGVEYQLVSICGGEKHNAIPGEATAVVITQDAEKFKEIANKIHDYAVKESKAIEKKNPKLVITETEVAPALTKACSSKVVDLLAAVYHGVWEMHPEIPGIVRTSQSMSITRTEKDKLFIQVYARSNEATMMNWLKIQNEATARLAGCPIRIPEEEIQGPWPAALSARITEVAKQTYKDLYGDEPRITAIHAGLECGIIMGHVPGLEAISIGPWLQNPHTVQERVNIASVEEFYRWLVDIVKRVA